MCWRRVERIVFLAILTTFQMFPSLKNNISYFDRPLTIQLMLLQSQWYSFEWWRHIQAQRWLVNPSKWRIPQSHFHFDAIRVDSRWEEPRDIAILCFENLSCDIREHNLRFTRTLFATLLYLYLKCTQLQLEVVLEGFFLNVSFMKLINYYTW